MVLDPPREDPDVGKVYVLRAYSIRDEIFGNRLTIPFDRADDHPSYRVRPLGIPGQCFGDIEGHESSQYPAGARVSTNEIPRVASFLHGRLVDGAGPLHHAPAKNMQLQEDLREATSPAFIEQAARDKLGLVREGETIVIMDKASGGPKTPKNPQELPSWKQWWSLFF